MEDIRNMVKGIVEPITKAVDARYGEIAQALTDVNNDLMAHIEELTHRCVCLEAIQIKMFSALSETNPSTHSKIADELKGVLRLMEENGDHNSVFAEHLRMLAGSQAGDKIRLRLLPKRAAPDSNEPNHH